MIWSSRFTSVLTKVLLWFVQNVLPINYLRRYEFCKSDLVDNIIGRSGFLYDMNIMIYSGWPPFAPLFCRGPLFVPFSPIQKIKKRAPTRISEEKMTKISVYVFFSYFSSTERNICLSFTKVSLYFQVFYVFNRQNLTYQESYPESVSYNWKP